MSSVARTTIFIKTLENFVDYLIQEFPDFQTELWMSQSSIRLLKTANPGMLVDTVASCLTPFAEHIKTYNEEFFLDINNVTGVLGTGEMALFKRVRDIWVVPSTSDIQKANIWLNLNKLLKANSM